MDNNNHIWDKLDDNAVIDIRAKGEYPSNELSNYAEHHFIIDGVRCFSMEGFLQSLKYSKPREQRVVCKLTGKEAKERGQQIDWKSSQQLYWNGTTIDRHSEIYQELLKKAYGALYESKTFRDALRASNGKKLIHSYGEDDPQQTVLTTEEFLGLLNWLRKKLENDDISA